MSRSVHRRPTARVASDRLAHSNRGDGLRKNPIDEHQLDSERDASADLLATHWLLVRELTALCGGIERAGSDVDSTLTSGLKALARIVPRATSLAFLRKGDLFIEVRRDARRKRRQIEPGEFLTFRSHPRVAEGAPSERVQTVSADDFACFHGFKRGRRDGLIALLGQADNPKALLILWPKNTLLQEDEDVFTVVASCMGSAFALAARMESESRRALAQKDADAAKMEVRAWRDMATRVAHLAGTPVSLARRDIDAAIAAHGTAFERDFLVTASRYLVEADQAFERAYMFTKSPETCLVGPINMDAVLGSAASEAGIACMLPLPINGFAVYGNQFRVWYAIRDLLCCARLMDPEASMITERIGDQLAIRVLVNVPLPPDVDLDNLFSAQSHVEFVAQAHCGTRFLLPAPLSLALAKQLIDEIPPGSTLRAIKEQGAEGFLFLVTLQLHKEPGS